MLTFGQIKPEALAVPAKALAEASRDAASFSLAKDYMIPQVALGLALQACVREAGLLGHLDLDDVAQAFSSALAGVIYESSATKAQQNRTVETAALALRGSLDAIRRDRRGRA